MTLDTTVTGCGGPNVGFPLAKDRYARPPKASSIARVPSHRQPHRAPRSGPVAVSAGEGPALAMYRANSEGLPASLQSHLMIEPRARCDLVGHHAHSQSATVSLVSRTQRGAIPKFSLILARARKHDTAATHCEVPDQGQYAPRPTSREHIQALSTSRERSSRPRPLLPLH